MSFFANRQFKLGFVGCGAAFELLYQPCLRRLSKKGLVRMIGFVDPNLERSKLASRLFPGSIAIADLKDLYANHDVDVTIIASPPPLHREHASLAFQAGSHVFCEKPLAESLHSAQHMVEDAQRFNRLLGVGLTRRYYPCLAQAHLLIKEKRFGRILSYRYLEGAAYTWPVASSAPFRRETAGGGVLTDKGVHVLDTLTWLFGPSRVTDYEDDSLINGVEANCILHLDHDGISGLVQLSWDQDLNNGFVIACEKAELFIPVGPMATLYSREAGSSWVPIPVNHSWPADLRRTPQAYAAPETYYECFDFQLLHFFRAMEFGEDLLVPMSDVLHSIATIQASYEKSKFLEQPWLSSVERDTARSRHWRHHP